MKNNVGLWIFLAIVVVVLTVVLTLRFSRSSASTSPGGVSIESSNPIEVVPVKMVAMYQYFGVTMILNSNNKGVISGNNYGEGSRFDWEDTPKTIELTNWDKPGIDGAKGTCVKEGDGALELVYHENGYRAFDHLYQVTLK